MSRPLRIRLFHEGSTAVSRVLGVQGWYLCPICGRRFDEGAALAGELTLEHVPPRAVGGRGLVLTCRDCNSQTGHSIEAELSRREENRRFGEFMLGDEPEYERHVILNIDGEPVRVAVDKSGGSNRTTFRILGDSNDPAAVERVAAYMSRLAEHGDPTGTTFTVGSGVPYQPRLARVAELKAAFLVSFAKYGYRYALSPPLVPVRSQLLSPDRRILPDRWMLRCEEKIESAMLLQVFAPRCLIVLWNGHGVVLPWMSVPEACLTSVKDLSDESGRLRVSGTPVPWPERLELLLDREEGGSVPASESLAET